MAEQSNHSHETDLLHIYAYLLQKKTSESYWKLLSFFEHSCKPFRSVRPSVPGIFSILNHSLAYEVESLTAQSKAK